MLCCGICYTPSPENDGGGDGNGNGGGGDYDGVVDDDMLQVLVRIILFEMN